MVKKLEGKRKVLVIVFVCILLIALIYSQNGLKLNRGKFEVNNILLKENLVIGGESSIPVKLKNNEDEREIFKIFLSDIGDEIFLDEDEISVDAGERKEFVLKFRDSIKEVRVYSGNLFVEGFGEKEKIPVVLEVNENDSPFAIIHEPIPNYKDVYPGGKFGISINIFNLKGSDKHKLNVDYSLKNFEGETLISDSDSAVVDESYSVTKIIDIPENFEEGNYLFVTSVKNDEEFVSSYFFEINKKENNHSNSWIYFILISLGFILIIFFLFSRFLRERDDMFLKLRNQQRTELENNLKIFEKYKKEIENLKNLNERKEKLGELKKNKREIIEKIKKKQKEQKTELKDLSGEKRKEEIIRQMEIWKKEGYRMKELKEGIKNIPKKDIEEQLKKWKSEGYKFSK